MRTVDMPMPRRPDYLTPEEYDKLSDEARRAAVGRKVDTYSAGVGVIAMCRDGHVRVRVQLRCERCKRRVKTFYLAYGSPGLCYVYDARGNYKADLRNQEYVCDTCPSSSSTPA